MTLCRSRPVAEGVVGFLPSFALNTEPARLRALLGAKSNTHPIAGSVATLCQRRSRCQEGVGERGSWIADIVDAASTRTAVRCVPGARLDRRHDSHHPLGRFGSKGRADPRWHAGEQVRRRSALHGPVATGGERMAGAGSRPAGSWTKQSSGETRRSRSRR